MVVIGSDYFGWPYGSSGENHLLWSFIGKTILNVLIVMPSTICDHNCYGRWSAVLCWVCYSTMLLLVSERFSLAADGSSHNLDLPFGWSQLISLILFSIRKTSRDIFYSWCAYDPIGWSCTTIAMYFSARNTIRILFVIFSLMVYTFSCCWS